MGALPVGINGETIQIDSIKSNTPIDTTISTPSVEDNIEDKICKLLANGSYSSRQTYNTEGKGISHNKIGGKSRITPQTSKRKGDDKKPSP